MNFEFNEDQLRWREKMLREGALLRCESGLVGREVWKRGALLGVSSLTVSSALGGLGLDALTGAIALDAFGFACRDNGLAFSLVAHLASVTMPVAMFGSEEQKARWFPGLCDGTWIGCHAVTEDEAGSDALALRSAAIREGEGYVLSGRKSFVTNSTIADMALVLAKTEETKGAFGGVTAFLVDLALPGVRRGPLLRKAGLASAPAGELVFEQVRLREKDVLGGPGGGLTVFTRTMNWERTLLFASHCGRMQRILEETIEFSRTRRQFGKPIGANQSLAHRMADLWVRLEAARLVAYRAAARVGDSRGICVESSAAKLMVSEGLVDAALEAVQIHGARGFLEESGFSRELCDALAGRIYSGTSEIQREIIARHLGL